MKVMIAGPRDLWLPIEKVQKAVDASGFDVTVHINGMAKGVDRSALYWALSKGLYVIQLSARWDYWREKGNAGYAGPERNKIASEIGDALIVIKREVEWTKGTTSIYRLFQGKPVHVEVVRPKEEL